MNIKTNKQLHLLIYKVLNDALLLWLIVFLGLLILEGLVPGYFSAYLSFIKMVLALFAIIVPMGYLGRRNDISFPGSEEFMLRQNKTAVLLLAVSFVLIANSLRDLGFLKAAIVSIGTFFTLVLLYKVLVLEEK